jgi:hypothetical protein
MDRSGSVTAAVVGLFGDDLPFSGLWSLLRRVPVEEHNQSRAAAQRLARAGTGL